VSDDFDGLSLSSELVDAIVRHCVAALPNEGCGLLAGRREGASLVADRFYPGTNRLASPSRFAMDPAEVVAALTAIDRDGHRLAAIVHSHPTTEAVPSRTDLREAYYPEALLLIVSLAGVSPRLRAWRPPAGDEGEPTVAELPIRVSPPR
jgi:proteasome lid subunit RPN8/RPN11